MATLAPLPVYPSTQARQGFSASQLAQFHSNLSNALAQVVVLPPAKRDTPSSRAFVSSYANDAAQQSLETLIWKNTQPLKHDDRLHQRVLLLAEKLASSTPGLELRTLLDLCVAFPLKATRLRSILSAALSGMPDLPTMLTSEVVPAFTALLSSSRSSGLYGLRKTACCLTGLLRPSPPDLIRPFAHSRDFLVALARAYDDGLTAISRSYGVIRIGVTNRQPEDWEQIWLETKVDIVDAFHLIMTTMVRDVSTASGADLVVEADRAFGLVFALLDVTPQSAAVGSADAVPFLNRSLIADYQHAYELSRTLTSALRQASRDNARIQRLESRLRSLDVECSSKDPGALKLILRSSGIAPGPSVDAKPVPQSVSSAKGKAKATIPDSTLSHDTDLDLQVAQVLDIFPDLSPEYIRKLLTHPSCPFRGNPERVIEALLEGTAPGEDTLGDSVSRNTATSIPEVDAPTKRRNVFDDEIMDFSHVHIGKKRLEGTWLDQDAIERRRINAAILRQVEAMPVDSDEEESRRPIALDVFDLDDDLDEAGASNIKVLGDGEDSGGEEVDPVKPETVLELAYIRDPKLFERDAETRRSKSRADLKQQTGWTDEQIEGWRIMLERNPKKERILQKHEFSGNRNVNLTIPGGTRDQPASGQRGGNNRGRGRGRGRGGGGSDGRSGGEKKEDVARERAFKEKHKSNYRKRGHANKMGKAGAGPSQ